MGRAARVIASISVVVGAGCAGGAQPAAPPPSPETSTTTVAPSTSTTTTSTSTTTTTRSSSTSTAPTAGAPATTAPGDRVVPEGFTLVAARATEPDGTVCELCLWLADTDELRSRGLMSVTDLGPADGMAFVYPSPTTGAFWMKNTVMPLSIAFFGAGGVFLDSFDMEPCEADPCPHYPTPTDFTMAVETAQGDLDRLSLVPGSVLELLGETCLDQP